MDARDYLKLSRDLSQRQFPSGIINNYVKATDSLTYRKSDRVWPSSDTLKMRLAGEPASVKAPSRHSAGHRQEEGRGSANTQDSFHRLYLLHRLNRRHSGHREAGSALERLRRTR